jgi:hypothetical protein
LKSIFQIGVHKECHSLLLNISNKRDPHMRNLILALFILIVGVCFVNRSFSQVNGTVLEEALYNMRKEASNSAVIYTDKTSPNSITANAFFLYLEKTNNQSTRLKLRIQYFGSTRLDVYEYIIKSSDNSLRLQSDYINKNYADFGNYNSWCDIDVTPSVLEFLRTLSTSSLPKLKYVGSYNNKERKLASTEVQAILNVIRLYDLLQD